MKRSQDSGAGIFLTVLLLVGFAVSILLAHTFGQDSGRKDLEEVARDRAHLARFALDEYEGIQHLCHIVQTREWEPEEASRLMRLCGLDTYKGIGRAEQIWRKWNGND